MMMNRMPAWLAVSDAGNTATVSIAQGSTFAVRDDNVASIVYDNGAGMTSLDAGGRSDVSDGKRAPALPSFRFSPAGGSRSLQF
jgi:hypothetical protein